jgi:chromosomal replication initiation ATPase DnaA
MHRTIEQDGEFALQLLNLSITDVLLKRGTKSIMDKKKLLYCYLRLECGYSYHEIGDYCDKDHTTILKVVNKHLIKYRAFSHKLKQTISE